MPFDSVTKSGRVRRQVPESGVRSVSLSLSFSQNQIMMHKSSFLAKVV